MRPETQGFQKPLSGGKRKKVRVAVIHDHEVGMITCSCTWTYVGQRKKVREERAQRHLDRKHGGKGIWL